MSGIGQRCPIDPGHGNMLLGSWEGQWCPSNVHGGNGRFFAADVEGYQIDEEDQMLAYEGAARAILDGRRDLETATRQVAKATGERTEVVRQRLRTMMDVVTNKTAERRERDMASSKKAKEAAAAEAADKPAKERAPRVLKEHVEPTAFVAIRDELQMTNTELAKATGKSNSRMTEFTKTKGGSIDQFEAFEHDARAYRAEFPFVAKEPKAPKEPKAKKVKETPAETEGETTDETPAENTDGE